MFCIFIGFNKKKMVGVKIPRVGVKITWGSLTPGGQAAQGVKINCYLVGNPEDRFSQNEAQICLCELKNAVNEFKM